MSSASAFAAGTVSCFLASLTKTCYRECQVGQKSAGFDREAALPTRATQGPSTATESG